MILVLVQHVLQWPRVNWIFKANSDLRPQFAGYINTGQLNLTTLLGSHLLPKIREFGDLSSLDPLHLLFFWTVISFSRLKYCRKLDDRKKRGFIVYQLKNEIFEFDSPVHHPQQRLELISSSWNLISLFLAWKAKGKQISQKQVLITVEF